MNNEPIPELSDYKPADFNFKTKALITLREKIESKELVFNPHEILRAIEDEAKRQYAELCKDTFKGMPISTLLSIREEVWNWYQEDQSKYEDFCKNIDRLKGLQTIPDAPVEQVTDLSNFKEEKKSKKKKGE